MKISSFNDKSLVVFSIDRNEFRNWATTNSESNSSYESGINLIGQTGFNNYDVNSQNPFESNTGIQTSYAAAGSSELTGSGAIQTSSVQQTNEYLSQTTTSLFHDPNPQIIRRAATGGPVTYQQKILVRFLQPPAVPPPGVIEEIFTVGISIFICFILATYY
jgi:hypothetical protein